VELRAGGIGVLNGKELSATTGDVRALLIGLVAEMAAAGSTPVLVQAHDPQGSWDLVVWPDGVVTEQTTPPTTDDDGPDRDEPWFIPGPPACPGTDPDAVDAPQTRAAGPVPVAPTVQRARLSTGSTAVVPVPVAGAPDDQRPAGPQERAHQDGVVPARTPTAATAPPGASPAVDSALVAARTLRGRPRRAARAGSLLVPGAILAISVAAVVITRGRQPGEQGVHLSTGATGVQTTGPAVTGSTTATTSGAPATPVTTTWPSPSPLPSLAAAPPGYGARARWGQIVDGRTKVAVGPRGAVFTRTPTGQLVALNSATGALTWTAAGQWGTDWDGPWATRIDDRPAVALTKATRLVYWQLPEDLPTATAAPAEPVITALAAGSTIRWTGPSPLIIPPGGGAAVVHDGAVHAVTMPAGAQALVADGTTVIAARGSTWIRSSPNTAPLARAIPTPRGVTGAPVRVDHIGSSLLLAVWPKRGRQSFMLIDTRAGTPMTQAAMQPMIDVTHGSVIRQTGGSSTAIGPLVVDTERQRVHVLLPRYTVRALLPGHVIATTGGRLYDIGLSSNGTFAVVPYPTAYPTQDVPFAVTANARGRTALTLLPRSSDAVLVGLPDAGT
jgi:hypothetical protein